MAILQLQPKMQSRRRKRKSNQSSNLVAGNERGSL